jgi:creatinine amidohydrolase
LLPPLFYGSSFEHEPFFNLSVKKTTLQKTLVDLCISLAKNNVRTVFIINGHYGNKKAFSILEGKVKKLIKGRTRVFIFSYWDFMKNHFDHAGFVETSLMLAISKRVKMSLAKKGFTTDRLTKQKRLQLRKLAARSFPLVTKSGVWGDPRKATKKEGQKLLSEIVKNLEKKCQTCLTGKNPKLHQ